MTAAASVVAYYGPKRPVAGEMNGPEDLSGLDELIRQLQARACRVLEGHFHHRDPDEAHATIIGLETARPGARIGKLLDYLRDRFEQGMTIQFGGFADADLEVSSRGMRLYERSFTISGRDVMLMGWPVEDGRPSTALHDVRRQCEDRGFTHKWFSKEHPEDPDCYLSLGKLDKTADQAAVQEFAHDLREFLSSHATLVPLARRHISLVVYEDRSLPEVSSTVYSL